VKQGDTIAGRFELERLAGSGGMATVWRARDRSTNQPVALKFLLAEDPTALTRFKREALLLAELEHPNIVRYVAHGFEPPFLAMEWLEGIDLADYLARTRPRVSDTLRLAGGIARALAAVHALGLVHRDIKPSNVFLVGGDIHAPKLVDFGLARGLASVDDLTRTNHWIGTPAYMSPEQARTDRATLATDVFAFGALLYECLTGKPAFGGPHVVAILTKIVVEDVGPPSAIEPDIPEDLDVLVSNMMAKEQSARPDVETVVEHLDTIEIDRPSRLFEAPSTLGKQELRFVSVVLVDADVAIAPTLTPEALSVDEASIDRLASTHRAPLVRLVGGSMAAVIMGEPAATDLATRAVRLALALREQMPDSPIVVATVQAVVGARVPIGEAIDRAASLFAPSRGVRVDEATRKLLDARFEIADGEVLGERSEWTARPLLGKATPCVGRDREIAFIADAFEQCVEQHAPRAVLLTGPAGIGKTRVVHEWLGRARAEVWMVHGDPVHQSGFGLLGQMLRNVAAIRVGESDASTRLRDFIDRTIPAENRERVHAFLGEILRLPRQDDEHPLLRAARLEPKIMSEQVSRAWIDLVDAKTSRAPLIVVVEDVHWCDEPTLHLVDHALRVLDDRPLFVVGLARSGAANPWPTADQTTLGPIGKRACEALVRAVIADATPEAIAKIVDQAAGNALLLEELLRAEGSGESGGETVLAIVSARLEGIHEHGRRLLRAASIYGNTFWRGGVAALLSSDVGVDVWLDRLVRMETIHRRPTSRFANEAEYSFRHSLVRDAAHATLIESDRRLGHAAAAEWLLQSGEPDAATLAEHYQAGGLPDRAVSFWMRAAKTSLEGNDIERAITRAERGIACGAAGEVLGELRAIQARAISLSGRDNAEPAALEALSLVEQGSASWFLVATEVLRSRYRAQDRAGINAIAQRMLETDPKANAVLHAALAAAAGARLLVTFDESDTCARMIDFAARVSRERSDPMLAVRLHRARSVRAIRAGKLGLALAEMRQARAEAEKLDNAHEVLASGGELIDIWFQVGQYERIGLHMREILSAARKLGSGLVPYLQLNLGLALARLGKRDEALAELDAALGTLSGSYVLAVRVYRADILLSSGDIDGARRDLASALDAGDDGTRALALGALARIELASGNAVAAHEAASEAMAIIEKLGGLYDGEMGVRLAFGESLEAIGRRDEAAAVFRQAKSMLLERAASIGDPELEKSFRENVEEHARILAR
jgi:tetratricopeptide (TPR) repeat protein